jgi:hypothetical protein
MNFIKVTCEAKMEQETKTYLQMMPVVQTAAQFPKFQFPKFVDIVTWTEDFKFEFSGEGETPSDNNNKQLAELIDHVSRNDCYFVNRLNTEIHLSLIFPAWSCVSIDDETYFYRIDETMISNDFDPNMETIAYSIKYKFVFNKNGKPESKHCDPFESQLDILIYFHVDRQLFEIDPSRSVFKLHSERYDSDGIYSDGYA